MCGIAGILRRDGAPADEGLLRRMCDAMVHRGPDDEGILVDGALALGMRRLKVIDLDGGRQPMANEDGTVHAVFNGEIYNYRELRADLETRGHTFRTRSDTEVIVHLFEERREDAFGLLRGMFALAIWESDARRLTLARDRLGKKPLFYAETKAGWTFGSELNVVLVDGQVPREIDDVAIDQYLTNLFVPQPRTIYRHVHKLPPGSWARVEDGDFTQATYWSLPQPDADLDMSFDDAVDHVDGLLDEAVRLRLLADVPVGAFLSGGVDSSLVAAYMRRAAGEVHTFAVGFEEASFNELDSARAVASELGTTHTEHHVGYDVRELLPRLLDHFGEPFADSSAIPTYHLSRVTRQNVTVALSGDGGDEVFGGYRRYSAWLWGRHYRRWIPGPARALTAAAFRRLPEPDVYYGVSWRKKARRFLEFTEATTERADASHAFFFTRAEKAALYTADFAARALAEPVLPAVETDLIRYDQGHYLPDDILVKVDRMSMACSLEVRSPLLDHRVVDFLATVPRVWKVTLRERKRLLRAVARRHVPAHVLARPKQGFSVPMASWLRGPLHDWVEELLSPASLSSGGRFRPEAVRGMVDAHRQGRRDLSQQLYALMVLELWLRGGRRA